MVEKELVAEEKRVKIIDAAQKRFAHFGLEKTTMLEIAGDLGISKASLYYYFTDKESIFKEVVVKEQAAFCKQMNTLIASNNKIDLVLKNYIEKRPQYLKHLLNLGKLSFEAFRANKPLFGDLVKIFYEHEKKIIKAILKAAMDRKEIEKLDIEEYSGFFVNVLKAIRLYELEKKELWDRGSIDKELNQTHILFTNMFLKSIKLK